jgi:hypothetical protein
MPKKKNKIEMLYANPERENGIEGQLATRGKWWAIEGSSEKKDTGRVESSSAFTSLGSLAHGSAEHQCPTTQLTAGTSYQIV